MTSFYITMSMIFLLLTGNHYWSPFSKIFNSVPNHIIRNSKNKHQTIPKKISSLVSAPAGPLFLKVEEPHFLWGPTAIRCWIFPSRVRDTSVITLINLTMPFQHLNVTLLALQAAIYYIWAETNGRFHRSFFRSSY